MTFLATLPVGVDLPEQTWLTARVRRQGNSLEVTAEDQVPSHEEPTREQALQAWLLRCKDQPVASLSDEEVDDLRWQGLKQKYDL